MHRISLVLVLGSLACAHDAVPPSNQAAPARAIPTADVLAFLPLNADVVVGVDTVALRASAVWAEYKPKITKAIGPQLTNVQRTCGFDPMETVQSVILAGYGKDVSNGVVVVRGLDRSRTTACLQRKIIPDTTVTMDRDVMVLTDKNGERDRIAFADSSTLVLQGSRRGAPAPEDLHAVLQAGSPLRTSSSFLEMFDRLERGATVWMVINGNASLFDDLATLGTRPRALYGTLRFAEGVAAKVHLRMATADQAAQLTATVQSQLQQASAMFDRLAVTTEGDVMTITAELSLDKLRSLISIVMTMAGAGGTSP